MLSLPLRFVGLHLHSRQFWTMTYYMKVYYALMSFPFLIFHIPILGEALYGAKITGYDKSGLLVPRLSISAVTEKQRLE